MKKFNVTAQVYSKLDEHKQTAFVAAIVYADTVAEAYDRFHETYSIDHEIVRIYSAEEIF